MDSEVNGELTDEGVPSKTDVTTTSMETNSDLAVKDCSNSRHETPDCQTPSKISNSTSDLIKPSLNLESLLPKQSFAECLPNVVEKNQLDFVNKNGVSDQESPNTSDLSSSALCLSEKTDIMEVDRKKDVSSAVVNSESFVENTNVKERLLRTDTNYAGSVHQDPLLDVVCHKDIKHDCVTNEIDSSIPKSNVSHPVAISSKVDLGSNNEIHFKPLYDKSKSSVQNCPVIEHELRKDSVPISSENHNISLKLGAPALGANVYKNVSHFEKCPSNLTIKNILSAGKQIYEIERFSALNLETSERKHYESTIKMSNPLEKLNEHLNSIGHVSSQPDFASQIERTAFPSPNVDISKTFQKERSSLVCSHDRNNAEPSDNLIFTELSNKETGFPDIFSGLVTIGKYISVKGDFTLRSSEALVESPSFVAPYLLKEPDSFPPRDSKQEQKDFFHSAAGELLIGIGISRVNEWFHRDMARIKKRQMKREGKQPQLEEDLAMHENFHSEAKKANSVYTFSYKSCQNCGFTTESAIVMEGHLLVPHITPRREYQCNFCDTINRDPKGMLDHMETVHGKTGRIQPSVLFFECPFCTTFESNSKVKLNTHLAKCQRFFDHATNQAPPRDFEFPALTPKPITVAVVKAYEKSLSSMQRGRGRPRKDIYPESLQMNQFSPSANQSPVASNHVPSYRPSSGPPLTESMNLQNQMIPPIQMPNMNIQSPHASTINPLRPTLPPMHLPTPPNSYFPVVNSGTPILPILGSSHLVTSPSQFPFSSTLVNSGSKKVPAPNTTFFNSLFSGGIRHQNPPKTIPEVTITPLPKLQGPYPVPLAKPSTPTGNASMQSNSLVVCEICDGYIKDLEQLRTHMQLIHKVKIHPKMLVSRPPLNCQKCQWRFFTDQGLERHLLGTHGLVTSNMQELANKGKDAGCCTICGRVYASKLVSHMNQTHKITLKPAHLSYKCTVCSATFNLYRLFENHVYLVHSGAAKRQAEGVTGASKKMKSDLGPEGEYRKDKRTPRDAGEENIKKCKECGNNICHTLDSQKCEKCLKSDILVHGKTFRDELRKNENCGETPC